MSFAPQEIQRLIDESLAFQTATQRQPSPGIDLMNRLTNALYECDIERNKGLSRIARETRAMDEVLTELGLDPEDCRTDDGDLIMLRVRNHIIQTRLVNSQLDVTPDPMVPTMMLRFIEREVLTRTAQMTLGNEVLLPGGRTIDVKRVRVLQQMWTSSDGTGEWRDVPFTELT